MYHCSSFYVVPNHDLYCTLQSLLKFRIAVINIEKTAVLNFGSKAECYPGLNNTFDHGHRIIGVDVHLHTMAYSHSTSNIHLLWWYDLQSQVADSFCPTKQQFSDNFLHLHSRGPMELLDKYPYNHKMGKHYT